MAHVREIQMNSHNKTIMTKHDLQCREILNITTVRARHHLAGLGRPLFRKKAWY